MKKNFVKEYFQIAKSFAQLIEDVSLLAEDCAKLAQESTFGDSAALKLAALGMPMAEALAALTDAVHMEDMKSAESWLNATDEEIGLEELEEEADVEEDDDYALADDVEYFDSFADFNNSYKGVTYKVVNSYFEGSSLNIVIRRAEESYNRYIRIGEHGLTDPLQWYQAAAITTDGYHTANVGDALAAAFTSGDLGYIGGPCDGVE